MKRAVFLLCFLAVGVGCETVPTDQGPKTGSLPREGVYHKVLKGQTLWRIAKVYQLEVNDIIKSNDIPNAAYIEENQLIFIPGAKEVKEIIVSPETAQKDEFGWPLTGKVIKFYGERGWGYTLKGIRIQSQKGVKVKASREGRVILADYLPGYGYTAVIDHTDGYLTVYTQNKELSVELDDWVFKSDDIAVVGEFGPLAYTDFQILRGTQPRNPLYYLPKL